MKPRVYNETTVVSYLTARPSRDLIVAGHQVRKEREVYAAEFDYNLEAMYDDLKKQEKKSGRKAVSLAPRKVEAQKSSAS